MSARHGRHCIGRSVFSISSVYYPGGGHKTAYIMGSFTRVLWILKKKTVATSPTTASKKTQTGVDMALETRPIGTLTGSLILMCGPRRPLWV